MPEVLKFKGQNYLSLVQYCKRKKILFKDDNNIFDCIDDAEKIILCKNIISKKDIQWLRPKEICEKLGYEPPKLFVDRHDRFDVKQGVLKDCYFLAALATLADNVWAFRKVMPYGQNFGEDYVGIFRFRFYRKGKWVEVVIDDRLPTINGCLIFGRSHVTHEFWTSLVEKAYAKFCGAFSNLNEGGTSVDAGVDLTGGIPDWFFLKFNQFQSKSGQVIHDLDNDQEKVLTQLSRWYEEYAMIFASIKEKKSQEDAQIKKVGLISNHAYTITGILKLHDVNLIRLRNPYGNTEWTGEWSDCSNNWSSCKSKYTNLHSFDPEDGEFFMSYKDFVKYFTCIQIVQMEPSRKSFQLFEWKGSGIMSIPDIYRKGNPKIKFSLSNPDRTGKGKQKCPVTICLANKEITNNAISVYNWNIKERSWKIILYSPMDRPLRGMSLRIYLEEGDYAIVLNHYARSKIGQEFQLIKSGVRENFHLRVYIESNWVPETRGHKISANLSISAQNIYKCSGFLITKPNPYLKISEAMSGLLYKTKAKRCNCNPTWGPIDVLFPDRYSKCQFEVWDETTFASDSLIGRFEASLEDLTKIKQYKLRKNKKENYSGKIVINLYSTSIVEGAKFNKYKAIQECMNKYSYNLPV